MRPGKFAPFIHTSVTTPYIGMKYLIALLPCVLYAAVSYGVRAIVLIAFSALLSMFFEFLADNSFSKKKDKTLYFDYSSISSGVVFALLLTPDSSLHVASVGILFGVLVVKRLFGGVGNNIFSVPVVGRLFVEAVFPSQLDTFAVPGSKLLEYKSLFFNSNTSLGVFQVGSDIRDYSMIEILAGRYPSLIGTGCVVLILVGFIYLLISKTIRITSSAGFVFAAFVVSFLLFSGEGFAYVCSRVLVSGALFAGAFLVSGLSNTSNSASKAFAIGFLSGATFVVCQMYANSSVAICVSVVILEILSFCVDYFEIGNRMLSKEVE